MAEIMKKLANMKKPMIAIHSGANLTLGTRPFLRHARFRGCQEIDRRTKKRGCSKVVRASRRAPSSGLGQALLGAPQHEVIL